MHTTFVIHIIGDNSLSATEKFNVYYKVTSFAKLLNHVSKTRERNSGNFVSMAVAK